MAMVQEFKPLDRKADAKMAVADPVTRTAGGFPIQIDTCVKGMSSADIQLLPALVTAEPQRLAFVHHVGQMLTRSFTGTRDHSSQILNHRQRGCFHGALPVVGMEPCVLRTFVREDNSA